MDDEKKSCWNCKYQDLRNDTLLGKCNWFPKHNKGSAKEIPPKVVDKGCEYFESK